MQAHKKTHQTGDVGHVSPRLSGMQEGQDGEARGFTILTSDPEEIKLLRSFLLNLLGPGWNPRPLEQNLD